MRTLLIVVVILLASGCARQRATFVIGDETIRFRQVEHSRVAGNSDAFPSVPIGFYRSEPKGWRAIMYWRHPPGMGEAVISTGGSSGLFLQVHDPQGGVFWFKDGLGAGAVEVLEFGVTRGEWTVGRMLGEIVNEQNPADILSIRGKFMAHRN